MCSVLASSSREYTVLSTAFVSLRDKNGNLWVCRAFLDLGFQAYFLTRKFCERMGLKCKNIKSRIGNTANSVNKEARIELRSRQFVQGRNHVFSQITSR